MRRLLVRPPVTCPGRAALPSLVLALALVLAACQQQVNLLTDPKAILAAAAASTATATSVHIDLTADGPIEVDPFGTGAGAAINLRGTTAAADIDLAGGKVRASFSSPNLINLAGEVIVLDGQAFIKSTLTGPKYLSTGIPGSAGASPAPSAKPLSGLTDLLARSDLQPVKGDDVPCAGGTCYTVTLHLTGADLVALGGGSAAGGAAPPPLALPPIPGLALPNISEVTADVTIHVEQVSTRLSGIDAITHLGDVGDPHLVATFTKWNEPTTIVAPPADQVQPAP